MKKRLFAIATLAALAATPALAADMAVKAPPPAVYSWAGFYVGGNIGGGWVQDGGRSRCFDQFGVQNGPDCQNVVNSSVSSSGFIGGGQIGYNWQLNSSWVYGVEADIQGANIKGSTVVNGPFPFFGAGLGVGDAATQFTAQEKIDWIGTARGRVGMTTGPALLYVTGGLAFGHADLSTSFTDPTVFTFSDSAGVTRAGWTAGGGAEWALAGHWSAKLEGLYYNLGTATLLTGPSFLGAGVTTSTHGKDFQLQGEIARLGLNYRFNAGP